MAFHKDHKPYDHPGGGDLVTKQSHADECDINNILRTYQRTGVITHVASGSAQYLELPPVMDLQEAMAALDAAQAAFAALPAAVREEFENDPLAFVQATQDPSQAERLERVGLLPRKDDAPPDKAESKAGAV